MTSLLTFLSVQDLGFRVALTIDEVVWVLPSVVVALIIDVVSILKSLEFILSKFEMNGYSSEFCCRLECLERCWYRTLIKILSRTAQIEPQGCHLHPLTLLFSQFFTQCSCSSHSQMVCAN